MQRVIDFSAHAWGWIFICGGVLGVVFFGVFFAFLEYSKWLVRRDMQEAKRNKR